MPELFSKIPQQFTEFWKNLDKSNKTKMIVISAIVFLSVGAAIMMITRPQYQDLVSFVEPRDARDVIMQLDKSNIEYRLQDNGTIQVKKNDLNRAKAALLQEGLPKGGSVSYKDEYGKSSLGTTNVERQRGYKEYLERDMAATLKAMDNVRNAVVKLSIPEKNVFFGKEESKVKASVAVDSYQELTNKQIKGIEQFVAGGVEGLSPEDVTILDSNANILNDSYDDDFAGSIDRQYALKQTVKRGVEKQVTELLAGTADNIKVMANLELDFDTLVTNKEIYEPVIDDKGIILSQQTRKETVINGTDGGAPGMDSNPPQYPNANTSETGEYKLTDETTNYEVNKTVQQSTKEIGKWDRDNSSIAIVMHYMQEPPADTGDGNVVNAATARADVDDVKATVASATGIPLANITVQTYDMPALTESKPPLDLAALADKYGALVLVGILIALIVMIILRVNNEQGLTEQEQPVSAKYNAANSEEMLPDIELEEKSEVKKQIEKFVKQKPDAVAQLLRNWLADDWD